MSLTPSEISDLVAQYAAGPDILQSALGRVPAAAMQWRPAEGEWSVHEIVVHCADSETASAHRLRVLIAEANPVIVGYDQAAWANLLNYHARPIDVALDAVVAARASTAEFARSLPQEAWEPKRPPHRVRALHRRGLAPDLRVHLHDHADQIASNVAAWPGN